MRKSAGGLVHALNAPASRMIAWNRGVREALSVRGQDACARPDFRPAAVRCRRFLQVDDGRDRLRTDLERRLQVGLRERVALGIVDARRRESEDGPPFGSFERGRAGFTTLFGVRGSTARAQQHALHDEAAIEQAADDFAGLHVDRADRQLERSSTQQTPPMLRNFGNCRSRHVRAAIDSRPERPWRPASRAVWRTCRPAGATTSRTARRSVRRTG